MEASGSAGGEYVVVGIISKLLSDLVERNDQLPLVPTHVTPFHSSRPPAITVKSYLEDRILKYAGCSEETFILALIYMDQVVQFNPDFVISSLNVHRLLITSIMLASKFFDDVYYNNAYYARVGGISNQEVNSLEMEMLRMISFSLFVQPEQYERYRGSLYSHVGGAGGAGQASVGAAGGSQQQQQQQAGGAAAGEDAATAGGDGAVAAAAFVASSQQQQQQQQPASSPGGISIKGGGGALFDPSAYAQPACFATGFAAAGGAAAAMAAGGGGPFAAAAGSPQHAAAAPVAIPQASHDPMID